MYIARKNYLNMKFKDMDKQCFDLKVFLNKDDVSSHLLLDYRNDRIIVVQLNTTSLI